MYSRSQTLPYLRVGLAVVALTSLVALGGCNKPNSENPDNRTVGQKIDSAVATTQQKAAEAKADAERAAQSTSDSAKNTADTMGDKAADAAITGKVNAALVGDPQLSMLKINVDTTQGQVRLTGTAPDAASRERATALARAVEGVQSVDNALIVSK